MRFRPPAWCGNSSAETPSTDKHDSRRKAFLSGADYEKGGFLKDKMEYWKWMPHIYIEGCMAVRFFLFPFSEN